jgi:hypothetical protein
VSHTPHTRESLSASLSVAGLDAKLAPPLAVFLALLERFDGAVDLVGAGHRGTRLLEHVLAALAGAAFVPPHGRLLDVGSGNGLPAVPLLLACPGVTGVLLEPRERRWAFLKEVVRELGLAAEVRRERLADHPARDYDAVTVQGLALRLWRRGSRERLREGGVALWWTSAANAATARPGAGFKPVLRLPQPMPASGCLLVWRRCST